MNVVFRSECVEISGRKRSAHAYRDEIYLFGTRLAFDRTNEPVKLLCGFIRFAEGIICKKVKIMFAYDIAKLFQRHHFVYVPFFVGAAPCKRIRITHHAQRMFRSSVVFAFKRREHFLYAIRYCSRQFCIFP